MKENNPLHVHATEDANLNRNRGMCHMTFGPHFQFRRINLNAKKTEHPCLFPNRPSWCLYCTLSSWLPAPAQRYCLYMPIDASSSPSSRQDTVIAIVFVIVRQVAFLGLRRFLIVVEIVQQVVDLSGKTCSDSLTILFLFSVLLQKTVNFFNGSFQMFLFHQQPLLLNFDGLQVLSHSSSLVFQRRNVSKNILSLSSYCSRILRIEFKFGGKK